MAPLPKAIQYFTTLFNRSWIKRYQNDSDVKTQNTYTGVVFNDSDRAIVAPIINRIAIDASTIPIRHALFKSRAFQNYVPSNLDYLLSVSANIDQTGRHFIRDVVAKLLDEGVVAIVPIESDYTSESGFLDVHDLRAGRIKGWYTDRVDVDLYNEETGQHEIVRLPKKYVAIVENPYHLVMNQPNSTMSRLRTKLALLDVVDNLKGAGKLDLILQLPYALRGEKRQQQANDRRAAITEQLENSKYGIAYIDATEKVTQLNRATTDSLLEQVEFLTRMLYGQLGIPQVIIDGTADEDTVHKYHATAVYPILMAICDSLTRTFIPKDKIMGGERLHYFPDLFKMIPATKLIELVDPLIRNEVATGNDMRGALGMEPSREPKADQLYNPHIANSNVQTPEVTEEVYDQNKE